MKIFKTFGTLLSLLLLLSSCLKSGLDELPNSDLNSISTITFEHRWIANNANGYETLCRQAMTLSNNKPGVAPLDKEIKTTITVPAANDGTASAPSAYNAFKTPVRNSVSRSQLYLFAVISPAAKIEPVDGAPVMGLPGDFSAGSYKYKVTSASGKSVIYTVTIDGFIK
ncbi:DUF5018-related domain-containing protein [Mucilaginibacter terrae]|uniref:DUF5018 domain-containing protein n=1 Tax=Mucilaginibacter terrae TaxID=1955052 RepID=A0ABU3GNN3_9SPHI|nr:hypothetical protein [Mucilaginibacter terrae]MDT3401200.1 hypothetical protein [Mucilaginibacter terrae]